MSTQRLRADLQSKNKFVVALVLSSLSEVGNDDMCRELAGEVAKVMSNTSSLYIKKKAVLAGTKIVNQSRESCQAFIEKLECFLEDKNPSVMQGSIQLCIALLRQGDREERTHVLTVFLRYMP